jgi:hypothetical protein
MYEIVPRALDPGPPRTEALLNAALDLYGRGGAPAEHVAVARALRELARAMARHVPTSAVIAEVWQDATRRERARAAAELVPVPRDGAEPPPLRLVALG